MTDRELMQQALEVMRSVLPELESVGPLDKFERALAAIITLRERLAQPEQTCEDLGYVPLSADGKSVYIDGVGLVRLAQPEQEPGTLRIDRLNQWLDASLNDRKPLTDGELADLWYKQSLDWLEFGRAIEAAHGIKENT